MAESDLSTLIREMRPEQVAGRFVFVQMPDGGIEGPRAMATVLEPEGLSGVIREEDADRLGLDYDFVAGWITLRVESSLSSVGLTAAVSAGLAQAGISCNMIAGLRHDHVLVPIEEVDTALAALKALSASG